MFLKLWRRHDISLRVEERGEELLRVEVLEARADGTAKFRLWYHKWRETRPDQSYVDVEIKVVPRQMRYSLRWLRLRQRGKGHSQRPLGRNRRAAGARGDKGRVAE